MENVKFKISLIDFMLEFGKHPVGQDKNGDPVHLGDLVTYDGSPNWFIVYRYGRVAIKQVGMMSMIHTPLNGVAKVQDTIAAGNDWCIIGYTDDPIYDKVKHLEHIITV